MKLTAHDGVTISGGLYLIFTPLISPHANLLRHTFEPLRYWGSNTWSPSCCPFHIHICKNLWLIAIIKLSTTVSQDTSTRTMPSQSVLQVAFQKSRFWPLANGRKLEIQWTSSGSDGPVWSTGDNFFPVLKRNNRQHPAGIYTSWSGKSVRLQGAFITCHK